MCGLIELALVSPDTLFLIGEECNASSDPDLTALRSGNKLLLSYLSDLKVRGKTANSSVIFDTGSQTFPVHQKHHKPSLSSLTKCIYGNTWFIMSFLRSCIMTWYYVIRQRLILLSSCKRKHNFPIWESIQIRALNCLPPSTSPLWSWHQLSESNPDVMASCLPPQQ